MRKRLLNLTAAAICVSMAVASPITPEQALNRAIGSCGKHKINSAAGYRLLQSETFGKKEAVYVFEKTGGPGFVITPADDRFVPLLGYGYSKIIDENGKIAPGCEYWLKELSRQIEAVTDGYFTSLDAMAGRSVKAPIEPMLTTLWNQREPYNNLCPPEEPPHSPTGCVATSTAQVMKYHNWPPRGEGSVSYVCDGMSLSIDFSETEFDWAVILDSYDENSPMESCDAVATLMKAVGYSVQMRYMENASGAASVSIAPALGSYFRYDKSLRYLLRNFYNLEEWEDIIYNSLVNYGPVIYGGFASTGGHSFVCDGYDGDGYFHFNWGWGGMSDGYFLLDLLEPEHQGVGGADGGFNYDQDLVCDIRPDRTGDSVWSYQLYSDDYSEIAVAEDSESGTRLLRLFASGSNYGPGTAPDVALGFMLSDESAKDSEPIFLYQESSGDLALRQPFQFITVELPDLKDGSYDVTPVYRCGDGEPVILPFAVFCTIPTTLVVTDGEVDIRQHPYALPRMSNVKFPMRINKLEPVTIKGTLRNSNDIPYLCPLSVVFFDQSLTYMRANSAPRMFDLNPLESIEVDYTTNVKNLSGLQNGDYYVAVALVDFNSGITRTLSTVQRIAVGYYSGVETAEFEETSYPLEYYTPSGVKVATAANASEIPSISSGIYIIKSTDGKTRKIAK